MLVEVSPMKVDVPCAKCRRVLSLTHEQLRQSLDDDTPPPCPWCEVKVSGLKPKPERTATDTLVLAVERLERRYSEGVDLSDLIVEAWGMDPERFGLPGHRRDYPSSKRVECEIQKMLRKLPQRPAWLVRIAPCRYRLTPAGAAWAKRLRAKGTR